jgi:hypothetical protein
MTANFFPPSFAQCGLRSVSWTICLTLLLNVVTVFASDYRLGPDLPDDDDAYAQFTEPMPLPQKRNPLLQRPNKQVVFDDLDPVASVLPPGFPYEGQVIYEEDNVPIRGGIKRIQPITDSSEEIVGEYPVGMEGFYTGPVCLTFGMGLFDNLSFFTEATTFKTGLNCGAGSMGLGEGLNWASPVTPQGTITAQFGIRAVQGDMFFQPSTRSQVFMTAGIFKRLEFANVQGGVAVDWLEYRVPLFGGPIYVRQMRTELSARSFRDFEYGFIGGFDVFRDRPTVGPFLVGPDFDDPTFFAVDVQDYYLLFARKHLDSGGQVELRCGATARGDLILNALGEVAINDRIAVNGGISCLTPSEGRSAHGNHRENWSMSLGVVVYFRGGATHRQANLYRPMFDVAGNNSFFTRIVGW